MRRRFLIGLLGISLLCGCGNVETNSSSEAVSSSSVPVSASTHETSAVSESADASDFESGTTPISVLGRQISIPDAWPLSDSNETTGGMDSYWDYFIEKDDTCMAECKITTIDTSLSDISSDDTFESYMDESMDSYTGNFDSCTTSDANKLSVDGVTALEYDLSGTHNSVDFTGKMVLFPTDNYRGVIALNLIQTEGCKKDHTSDFDKVVQSISTPEAQSIMAEYSGNTQPGTKIETGMSGIFVTVTRADGSTDMIDGFDNDAVVVQNPGELTAGKNTFTVEYNGLTCEMNILCQNEYVKGGYHVGDNIPSGEYVLLSDGGSGYFCVSSDANGDNITFNGNFGYDYIITVNDGEYLRLSRCKAYPYNEWKQNNSLDTTKSGMFKIGSDLPAGTYTLNSTEGEGYWCVYSDSRESDIVSNENFSGQSYCQVSDGQYLLLNRCTIQQ